MIFSSSINIDEKYFYMPFGPTGIIPKDIGLRRIPFSNLYIDVQTGTRWRQCLLYDTGWGNPIGFERLPELQFSDLIKLALCSDYRNTALEIYEEESNKYGAIAVIMERHVEELLSFLNNNLENNALFCNPLFNKNLRLFGFDAIYVMSGSSNGVYPYENMLNNYAKWREIAPKVKKLVYSKNS